MTQNDRQEMREFEDAAERAGGFVSPMLEGNVHYDYRKILAYCKEKQIDPRDMTIRELDKFILPKQ